MNFSYVVSEKPRYSNNKRLHKCNRCQKSGHYAHEYSASSPVLRGTERNYGPNTKKGDGRGSDFVAKSQQRSGPPKQTVGVSRGATPY